MEKWEFTFKLYNKICCDDDVQDRENICFDITRDGKNNQPSITGFKIITEADDQKQVEESSIKKASRLVQLMSASSGTYTDYYIEERTQLSGNTKKVTKTFSLAYSIQNNAVLSMSDEIFLKLINGKNRKYTEKIYFMSKARQDDKYCDFEGVIKNLFLACHECPTDKKFEYLRNVLSHNKDHLWPKTIKSLNKKFGAGYFKLTNDNKFDFESIENKKKVKKHAKEFLKSMHIKLREELERD